VIVENSRSKKLAGPKSAGDVLGHGVQAENYRYVSALATMARFKVNLLFSESSEETAHLLAELQLAESKKGFGLRLDGVSDTRAKSLHGILQGVTGVNFAVAHALASSSSSGGGRGGGSEGGTTNRSNSKHQIKTVADVVNADCEALEAAAPGLPRKKSLKLRAFFAHSFGS
jgi:hypothetical protein